jgi:cysteine-rich repeat protein
MKRLIALVLFLAASLTAATDLTVTVPQAAVAKAVEMCDVIRVELRVRSTDWNNDTCASVFTRIGLRVYVQRQERQGQQQAVDDAVQAEVDLFDANWPVPFIRAYCGDGILDAEFGEECDDGGNEDGDGCSARCKNE